MKTQSPLLEIVEPSFGSLKKFCLKQFSTHKYHKRNECDEGVIENNDMKFPKEAVWIFGNCRCLLAYNFHWILSWAKDRGAELMS